MRRKSGGIGGITSGGCRPDPNGESDAGREARRKCVTGTYSGGLMCQGSASATQTGVGKSAMERIGRLESDRAALVEMVRALIADVTDEDHRANDWSERFAGARKRG